MSTFLAKKKHKHPYEYFQYVRKRKKIKLYKRSGNLMIAMLRKITLREETNSAYETKSCLPIAELN